MLDVLTSEARALIEPVMVRRRAKAEARRAWLEEYHKQLAKGNSNMDRGAKKVRTRARKVM